MDDVNLILNSYSPKKRPYSKIINHFFPYEDEEFLSIINKLSLLITNNYTIIKKLIQNMNNVSMSLGNQTLYSKRLLSEIKIKENLFEKLKHLHGRIEMINDTKKLLDNNLSITNDNLTLFITESKKLFSQMKNLRNEKILANTPKSNSLTNFYNPNINNRFYQTINTFHNSINFSPKKNLRHSTNNSPNMNYRKILLKCVQNNNKKIFNRVHAMEKNNFLYNSNNSNITTNKSTEKISKYSILRNHKSHDLINLKMQNKSSELTEINLAYKVIEFISLFNNIQLCLKNKINIQKKKIKFDFLKNHIINLSNILIKNQKNIDNKDKILSKYKDLELLIKIKEKENKNLLNEIKKNENKNKEIIEKNNLIISNQLTEIKQISKEKEEMKNQILKLNQENDYLKNQNPKNEITNNNENIVVEKNNEINILNNKINELNSQINKLNSSIMSNSNKYEDIINNLKNEKVQLISKNTALENEILLLKEEVNTINQNNEKNENNKINKINKNDSITIDTNDKIILNFLSNNKKNIEKDKNLKKENETYILKINMLSKDYQNLQKKYDIIDTQKKQEKEKNKQLEAEKTDLNSKIQELNTNITELNTKIQNYENKIKDLEKQINFFENNSKNLNYDNNNNNNPNTEKKNIEENIKNNNIYTNVNNIIQINPQNSKITTKIPISTKTSNKILENVESIIEESSNENNESIEDKSNRELLKIIQQLKEQNKDLQSQLKTEKNQLNKNNLYEFINSINYNSNNINEDEKDLKLKEIINIHNQKMKEKELELEFLNNENQELRNQLEENKENLAITISKDNDDKELINEYESKIKFLNEHNNYFQKKLDEYKALNQQKEEQILLLQKNQINNHNSINENKIVNNEINLNYINNYIPENYEILSDKNYKNFHWYLLLDKKYKTEKITKTYGMIWVEEKNVKDVSKFNKFLSEIEEEKKTITNYISKLEEKDDIINKITMQLKKIETSSSNNMNKQTRTSKTPKIMNINDENYESVEDSQKLSGEDESSEISVMKEELANTKYQLQYIKQLYKEIEEKFVVIKQSIKDIISKIEIPEESKKEITQLLQLLSFSDEEIMKIIEGD